MKERAPQNGFTLFEVLMTLAIMAVLFSILYMVFHESMAVMASAEEQTEIVQEGRLILEKMTGELKAVFFTFRESTPRSFQYGLVGRSGMERGNFTDRLDFTALTPPFADLREDGGEILEVGYFLEREPGGRGLTLYRRQDRGVDGNLLKGGQTLAVCDRVRSLRFSYVDRQGRVQKEWNSLEGVNRGQLPVRIEIQLKMEGPAGKVVPFRTQVCLPLAGGMG